jgi:GNS1/SUR4 family
MMYSYYTMSLLKISCPWKRYLTMAQLTQFATVLCYSAYSVTHMPAEADWRHYLGHSIQSFEMISLFALFMLFFRKAYAKKAPRTKSSSDSISLESKVELESLSSASTEE